MGVGLMCPMGCVSPVTTGEKEGSMVTIQFSGEAVGVIMADQRVFKTGSRGFYGNGKIASEDGKRYQVSCSIVEIGSKPGAGKGKTAKKR